MLCLNAVHKGRDKFSMKTGQLSAKSITNKKALTKVRASLDSLAD